MDNSGDKYKRWFFDLEVQYNDEVIVGMEEGNWMEPGCWTGWALRCKELLRQTYGEQSAYHTQYSDTVRICGNGNAVVRFVEVLYSIFSAAKSDYDAGYAHSVDLRISGEVYGDFISLAKATLENGSLEEDGNLKVAAVLAAASLEDVLKRFARSHGIVTNERTLSDVIGALKAKNGLLQRGTIEALRPLPKIRNFALHADWEKLSNISVFSVISFVEQFLVQYFPTESG